MKKMSTKLLAIATAGVFCAGGLSACSSNEGAETEKKEETTAKETAAEETSEPAAEETTEAAEEPAAEEENAVTINARPDECGLQEQEGPAASFGLFDAAVMYFQPGQMAPNPNSDMKMLDYADAQMHIELDLKANAYATNWGYSVDETPANLSIAFKMTDKDGAVKAEGMMMPMNAIDGSHYGTNLPKDTVTEPGDYNLTITIFPPKNYDMHADYITGVPAEAWFKPLTANMDWKITQENLDAIKAATVENPMEPAGECTKYPKKMFEDKTASENMSKAEATEPLEMHMMHH